MLKHFWAKILFLGIGFLASSVGAAPMTPRQAFYYHAERGNKVALAQLQQMGYPIDVSDEYGNSALCEAVIKGNSLAIQTLVQMGADTNADCMQALSANVALNKAVIAVPAAEEANQKERLAPKEVNKIPNPPSEPLSKNTKVGIGLGVTTALIAGGVTAALIANGGGSSTTTLNCVNGVQVGKVCQCNAHAIGALCESCESGYDFYGTTTCHKTITCKTNAHQVGDSCQCDEGYTYEGSVACYKDLCSQYENMHQEENACVCDSGFPFQGETGCYEEKTCSVAHTVQKNNTCVCSSDYPITTYEPDGKTVASCAACGVNMIYVGNECVCKEGFPFQNEDGCFTTMECHHGTQSGPNCVCDPGWADDGTVHCNKCDTGFTLVNGDCVAVALTASTNTNTSAEGLVYTNTGESAHNADIIGLYSGDSTTVVNAMASSDADITRKITITNQGGGSVYGMYGIGTAYGTYNPTAKTSSSIITLKNSGTDTYGIYGQTAYGTYNKGSTKAESALNINTGENENKVYGIYSANNNAYGVYDDAAKKPTDCSSGVCSKSSISIHNSLGTSYGIYSTSSAYGAFDTSKYQEATDGIKNRSVSSVINLYQWGGIAYGMRGAQIFATDTNENFYDGAENTINIQMIGREKTDEESNITLGKAIGMRSLSGGIYNTKTGVINVNLIGGNYQKATGSNPPISVTVPTDDTAAIGIYADSGVSVTNAGAINITRNSWTDTEGFTEATKNTTYTPGTTGKAFGIYVVGNSSSAQVIKNTGTITVSGEYDKAYGIYVDNGKNVTVENAGTIIVDSASGYGIYFNDGTGGKVKNSGTIKTGSGDDCEGDACDNSIYALVKNGATFINSSTGGTGTSSLNLAAVGATVVAGTGSNFATDGNISGTLHIDTDVVTNGFARTYTEKGMIQAGDTSGLKLVSDSALFDATLDGNDVVMTMKGFGSTTPNKSLADFLNQNYALGNNEAFYNKLKSFGNMSNLTDNLNKLTGKDMLNRFNFEDMTMMRELNFDMNEKLFHNKEPHFALAGSVTPMAFKGDNGSSARYSLFNKRDGNKSIGLGIAFTNVRSDDDKDNNNRSETSYQLILPLGYKVGGFNLVTSPRIGYARGIYDRTGFDNSTYDGILEKRVFGLMNEVRYPITVGKWKFEPAAEFNILGYQQKGHEEDKEFALNIQNQNTLSVESGIGLYATREENLDKDSSLKLTAGIAAYHEFADPYRVKVGMNGMEGAFTLRDEKRSDNRGVIRAGFDYAYRDLSLYGSLISYIDKEARTSAKTGMRVQF